MMVSDKDKGSARNFRIFRELDAEGYSVFRDKGVLSLSYVPPVLVGREREATYFARVLTQGVRERFLPPMIRVFGGPGSGKTAVVRSVLERFGRFRRDVFQWFYVNLKRCRSVFSASNAVLSAICGRRLPVNLGLDRVFTEIWGEIDGLKGGQERLFLCLVLDEVDAIFQDRHFDPSDLFYRFLRHPVSSTEGGIKLCLVTITNNLRVLEDNLDARVTSSMGGEMILFPSYSKAELKAILQQRVEEAFQPGMVGAGVVGYCAQLAAEQTGDARQAIDLLRVTGEIANERQSKVTLDLVHPAWERVKQDWVRDLLNDLQVNSAVILGLVAFLTVDQGTISTGELYRAYKKGSHEGLPGYLRKLSERRVLDILNDLETVGLISTWNVSRGRRGYGKEIRMNVNPQDVLVFYATRSKPFGFKLSRE